MLKEFKEFALRGNVMELAIAVIIGTAFGAIVTSVVTDLLMPPLGKLAGNVDFKDLFVPLDGKTYESLAAAKTAGAPVIAYGSFINTVVNFLIIAFVIFLVTKQLNRLKKRGPADDAPSTKECPFCANNIPVKASRCGFCTSELDRTTVV
jgi:large conductance mechanosensitive channel